MKINTDINKFAEFGYVVLDLYSLKYLDTFKSTILNKARDVLKNDSLTFEEFHQHPLADNEKIILQYEINKMIWEDKLHLQIIKDNIEIYHDLIGKDLDIQSKPYLRIVRPNSPQDNIGFHRDGMYGNSAYEISNFIPLINLDPNNALLIEPSSHKRGAIPFQKIESTDVRKGDIKSQLGFPYAPKIIDSHYPIQKVPIPLEYGQVLIFGLGLIHGQEVNISNNTRWSLDTRVKNSFAHSGTKDGYYIKLSSSPVSECAEIFYSNNTDET